MSDGAEWEELIETPDRRFDRETPLVGRWWLLDRAIKPMPETDIQALMEAAPHEPIPTSKQTQQTVNERLQEIVENDLDETEKAVIEITVYAGHSIRHAAQLLKLPKSTVHRIKESALERIRRLIEMDNND